MLQPAACARALAPVLAGVMCLACLAPRAGAQSAAAPDLAAALAASEVVDLTHTFDETTLVWPTSDAFRLEKVADGLTAAGFYYASNVLHTTEHGGTHLDAPIHFAAGQVTADKVPLHRLVGPAAVIDVTDRAARDPDYLITTDDVRRWEATHGRIAPGALVLLRTGWSSRWPDAARYLGTSLRGEAAVAQLHFPGLHPDTATFLVRQRQVGAVGIDTASLDRGQSSTYEAHRVLAAAGIPGFENLTNLDLLPPTGSMLVALPMKIGGGSGGPLRAVAIVPRGSGRNGNQE